MQYSMNKTANHKGSIMKQIRAGCAADGTISGNRMEKLVKKEKRRIILPEKVAIFENI